MDIDLKRLEQILSIVQAGSFSRAAAELHLTQPALSRSVAALEERYGFRIFERGRGGATLTALGRLVVEEAEDLLRRARVVDHNLHLYGRGEAGRLAFGMGPLIASLVLPALSVHFLRTRPELRLQAVAKSAAVLYEELMDDRIEVLFCGGDQLADRADLASEAVGRVSIAAIVRASHPLAGAPRVVAADIAPYPILSGVEMRLMWDKTTAGSFVCDNYHILRETVLATDAVWVSSPQFVQDDIGTGRLRTLAMTGNTLMADVEVCMVSREASRLTPAAEAIRDYVRDYLAAPGKAHP